MGGGGGVRIFSRRMKIKTHARVKTMKFTDIDKNHHKIDYPVKFSFIYKMGQTMRKLNKKEEKEEKKIVAGGEQKKVEHAKISPDPSVDEYILLYHTSWQPGVPEHLHNFKAPLLH